MIDNNDKDKTKKAQNALNRLSLSLMILVQLKSKTVVLKIYKPI